MKSFTSKIEAVESKMVGPFVRDVGFKGSKVLTLLPEVLINFLHLWRVATTEAEIKQRSSDEIEFTISGTPESPSKLGAALEKMHHVVIAHIEGNKVRIQFDDDIEW